MKLLIVEAAVARAILDQRAVIPPGEALQALVTHTWGSVKNSFDNLPDQISDKLMNAYAAALEFIHKNKFAHHTVANVPIAHFYDRLLSFFFYGKAAFINNWGYKDFI